MDEDHGLHPLFFSGKQVFNFVKQFNFVEVFGEPKQFSFAEVFFPKRKKLREKNWGNFLFKKPHRKNHASAFNLLTVFLIISLVKNLK